MSLKVLLAAVALAAGVLGPVLAFVLAISAAWDRGKTNLLQCPRCGRCDICPSRPGGMGDALFARFDCAPFRCRDCSKRFYRYQTA